MIPSILRKFKQGFENIRGWHTGRKIIVFESDDWGSIRMPSKNVYNKLLGKGIKVDLCDFNKYDSLASELDLLNLFELLQKFMDEKGNYPQFTANIIMSNPDFKKIEENNFETYHFESFTTTLKSYPNHNLSFDYWKQGIKEGVFFPQLHGREHVNIARWLKGLKNGNRELKISFNNKLFGLSTHILKNESKSLLAALDYDDDEILYKINHSLSEAMDIFYEIFGYRSQTFIAPNYTWNSNNEKILSKGGVNFLQSGRNQIVSSANKNTNKRHYLGEKNQFGQTYLLRNCYFEPSTDDKSSIVNKCLDQIDFAFKCQKPAVISTHRLNYIGYIDEKNRDENLRLLEDLLRNILLKWPEVEFLNSKELGVMIHND